MARKLTFHFRVKRLEIRLVDANKTLLPVAGTLNYLADLLGLLFIGKSTYPIPRDNILEHR